MVATAIAAIMAAAIIRVLRLRKAAGMDRV